MYSVVLSALVGFGSTAPSCHSCRSGQAGCAGCGSHAGYMGGYATPVNVMPAPGCGCASCGCTACGSSPCGMPAFGGMAMPVPMAMGGMPMEGTPMPGMPMPGMPMPPADGLVLPPAPALGESVQPPMPGLGEARTSASQATFIVSLPADARLLADNVVVPHAGPSPVRVFVTPPLDPGREYFYDLSIEVDRGGKVLRDQQTVKFRAGEPVRVTFAEPKAESPAPPAAGKTARIRVTAPAGAVVFVEGRPWTGTTIQTPPLDDARTHYYQLRAEVVRNGRLAVVTREVAFRAGQELVVDLTAASFAQIAKATR